MFTVISMQQTIQYNWSDNLSNHLGQNKSNCHPQISDLKMEIPIVPFSLFISMMQGKILQIYIAMQAFSNPKIFKHSTCLLVLSPWIVSGLNTQQAIQLSSTAQTTPLTRCSIKSNQSCKCASTITNSQISFSNISICFEIPLSTRKTSRNNS